MLARPRLWQVPLEAGALRASHGRRAVGTVAGGRGKEE
jgi:hypothetical protein